MKTMKRRGSTPAWGAGLGLLGLLICVAIGMWMYAQMGEVSVQGYKSAKETSAKAIEQVDQIKRQMEKQILEQNKQMGVEPAAPAPPTTQPAGTPATTPPAKPAGTPATTPPAGTLATTTPPPTAPAPATQPATATPPAETPAVRTRPKNMVGNLQKQIDERYKDLEK